MEWLVLLDTPWGGSAEWRGTADTVDGAVWAAQRAFPGWDVFSCGPVDSFRSSWW